MSELCAVIGGSGLYHLADDFYVRDKHKTETPYGPVGAEIEVGEWQDIPVVFLPRHGREHAIPPHRINYRANLWALQQLGVRRIIALNAVGGISTECSPRTLVLPDQIIDYTCNRENSFHDGENLPLAHIDFTWPYSVDLRQCIIDAAARNRVDLVKAATYGCTNGPRLETAAEIRKMAADGCHIIGMTAMPEAALARELNIEYAAIALVVNWCAGLGDIELGFDEILQILEQEAVRVRELLKSTLQELHR